MTEVCRHIQLLKILEFISNVPTLLLSLSVTFFVSANIVCAEPVGKVLVLEQKHCINGRQKLYISKVAVRLEQELQGIVVITRAPFREVEVINPLKHNYVRKNLAASVAGLHQKFMIITASDLLSDAPWEPGEKCKVLNSDAISYVRRTPKKSWYKTWVLEEPKLPKPVVELICALSSNVPFVHGMPLRCTQLLSLEDERPDDYETLPSKATTIFDTISTKLIDAPAGLFSLPADYRCVNGSHEAVPNTSSSRNRNAMMQSPDFLFQSSKKRIQGIRDSK